MKFLIIGIDGGTKRILEGFEMPFVSKLMKEGVNRELEEDLFSRGWAEIVFGKTAEHTGAFYMSPKLDGSHDFSISYKTKDSESLGCIPIWKMVENFGYSVGVMNVPTTSPAQKVNGFMVGSGGGGLNKVDGLPVDLVYPRELKEFLQDKKYVVDIRLTTSGIADLGELFQALINKEKIRAKAFVELSRSRSVDFGFLVDRATTIVQYLCMSEIETYLAMKSMPEVGGRSQDKDPESNFLMGLLKQFYKELDNNIKFIVESLEPDYFLLTADHSTVPYKYKGNLSAFLEEEGFLVRPSVAKNSSFNFLKSLMRPIIGSGFKKKIKNKIPSNFSSLVDQVDWKRTKAFGHNYVNGVYLNDKRFNGPVSDIESDELQNTIITRFNNLSSIKERGIKLKPYRNCFKDTQFQDRLPDLILDKPDELHVVNQGSLIYSNPNYGPLPELKEVKENMFTGQKGRNPIFLMNPKLSELIEEGDSENLTLAYTLAHRAMAR